MRNRMEDTKWRQVKGINEWLEKKTRIRKARWDIKGENTKDLDKIQGQKTQILTLSLLHDHVSSLSYRGTRSWAPRSWGSSRKSSQSSSCWPGTWRVCSPGWTSPDHCDLQGEEPGCITAILTAHWSERGAHWQTPLTYPLSWCWSRTPHEWTKVTIVNYPTLN